MSLAFQSAEILLPKKELDYHKWSVVACDQYTSEPEYWKQVEDIVGEAPSTGKLILPEVYLNDPDVEKRLSSIGKTMDSYLARQLFDVYKDAMIYVERTDSSGRVRAGIVGAIDLEQYDYHPGSTSLVRATESTVIERIPPRIKVRKSAKIELPHIMILIDDPANTVIEPLAGQSLPVLYDFDLMQGGGHLKGSLLGKENQKAVLSALDQLGDPVHFRKAYNLENTPVLLYAMGDGNHSLATAKEFYEQLKTANPDRDLSDHPARYALVEIVNLHSPALEFEAIHRIVTDVNVSDLKQKMTEFLGLIADPAMNLDKKSEKDLTYPDGSPMQQIVLVENGIKCAYTITKPCSRLTVGSLQTFLDAYLTENKDDRPGADLTGDRSETKADDGINLATDSTGGRSGTEASDGINLATGSTDGRPEAGSADGINLATGSTGGRSETEAADGITTNANRVDVKKGKGKIDYIHGVDVVLNLTRQANSIGFLLPDMGKEELFPTVITDGALPRKTFSMGHAQDKRFYMECRRITE